MAQARVYIVSTKFSEGQPVVRRLVRASHPSHALRHVAADQLQVTVASQDDLIDLLGRGVAVETVRHEQAELPT
ncbi:hypothetical protein [Methylibium sp. Pch-M]|uniref:hypothetical protein n=1 Tax=Methylibium sp. Pch-M TaxID=2082386 RepID=UPI001013696D|nr:hypothetical protein [Methylibium sp. Pch-M]